MKRPWMSYRGRVAGATKTYTINGIKCDSKLEAYMYDLLVRYNIKFVFQKKFVLQDTFRYKTGVIRAITWTVDFVFEDLNIVMDTKGFATDVAKIKMKMFKKIYGDKYDLQIVKNKKEADNFAIWIKALMMNKK